MKARIVICIAMGLCTAHLGIFMLIYHFRENAKPRPALKQNFSARTEVMAINPATGEKMLHRTITVSTDLADPSLLEKTPRK